MKMLIEIPDTDRALLMDAEHAGAMAKLLSDATLVRSRGYGRDAKWIPVEDTRLSFTLCDEKRFDFTPLSEREQHFQKDAEKSSSERWDEYRKRETAEKRVKELEEQLALVKSMTVCETAPVVEAPPVETPVADSEEIQF